MYRPRDQISPMMICLLQKKKIYSPYSECYSMLHFQKQKKSLHAVILHNASHTRAFLYALSRLGMPFRCNLQEEAREAFHLLSSERTCSTRQRPGQRLNGANTTTEFWPPNPNELEIPTCTWCCCFASRTVSNCSTAGSGFCGRDTSELYLGKSPIFTLELLQKSNFQPSTIKSDNIGHPTVKTGQIWPLDGFEGDFAFFRKN